MSLFPWLVYAAVMVAAFALVEGVHLLVSGRSSRGDSVTRRLGAIADRDRATARELLRRRQLSDDTAPWLAPLLGSAPVRRLDDMVLSSGLAVSTRNLIMSIAISFPVTAVLLNVLKLSLLLSLATAAFLTIALPLWFVYRTRQRRLQRIVDQLPDALDVLVRSLRAGHPVPAGIGLVAHDMPDPIGTEFDLVYDEMSYGLALKQALEKMSRRLGLHDIDYMVAAIRIQSDTGGNLAEVLGSLATVMRERQKLFAKVRALSAESILSAKILAVLPIAIFGFIMVLNPTYYATLGTDPTLRMLLGVAAGLVVAGWVLLRRVVAIKP